MLGSKRITNSPTVGNEFDELFTFLKDWTPTIDVFAIKYVMYFTSATTAMSAAFINAKIRKGLKLRNKGFISSAIPVIMIPSIVGASSHFFLVTKPLLTREIECPICLEVRSGFLTVANGIVYPSILAQVCGYMNANRYYTYAVPNLIKEPMECLKLSKKIFSKFSSKFFSLTLLLFLGGIAFAHWQVYNLQTVFRKIGEMDKINQQKREQKTPVS